MNQAEFFIPNETFIKKLKVGSLAPNSFGKWSKVVEITCQKDDINGMPFEEYKDRYNESWHRPVKKTDWY